MYLLTNKMPADKLTKNLSKAYFERFKALFNLKNACYIVAKTLTSKGLQSEQKIDFSELLLMLKPKLL